ncbi:hypothetical protein [Streptomyces sp. NPDC059816]|uniref:hypothetical protein n=1 Tax=Streptomyces sp. NPDC059816 TaxID=3346960 RepID=UPI00366A2258
MHIHGYLWVGPKAHFDDEGLRRPPHPEPPPPPAGTEDKDGQRLIERYRQVVAEFPLTGIPPIQTAHWLIKQPNLIRGTWQDPKEAEQWLGCQLAVYAPRFASEQDRDGVRLAACRAFAVETLGRGGDVSFGYFLTRPTFLSLALVVCSPNRAAPELSCPIK